MDKSLLLISLCYTNTSMLSGFSFIYMRQNSLVINYLLLIVVQLLKVSQMNFNC